jgi:creatinine amidohydrolase
MAESVLYEELTPRMLASRMEKAPIAYLPLGTLEWHGAHMPLGADGLQSQGFFEHLAREAGGVVLPMLFVGPDRHVVDDGKEYYGMDLGRPHIASGREYQTQQLPGSAYWVTDNVFAALVLCILKQLKRTGFKIVVAHGHGPSTIFFRDHAEEYEKKLGLKCFVCWGEQDGDDLGIQVDHGAANETSLVMALRPTLVQMENLPRDLNEWPLAVGGRDPRVRASADLGKKAIATQLKRMSKILRDALKAV